MESVVWQVSVLLAVAAFLGLLAQRLGQPALLGYLAAGLALGPAGFHVVRQLDLVALASEVGTVLLLFVLGLQFSWSQLVAFGTRVLRLGVGQVVLTFSVAALAAWALTESVAEAWVIGAAAAFSSTTTVGKILESNRQVDSPVGRASLGTQLVQDVAVVPFMMAVTVLGLASGRSALPVLAEVVGFTMLFAVVAWAASAFALPRLLHVLTGRPRRELQVIFGFALLGLGIWIGKRWGVSPALAAFFFGAFLGESEYAAQLKADVSGVKEVFLCLFFASAGMNVELGWLRQRLALLLALTVGLVAVKLATGYLAARWAGWAPHLAWAVALALAQMGEFSFVLVRQAATEGLVRPDLAQAVVSLTVLTMALAPALVKLAFQPSRGRSLERPASEPERPRVLVIGYGPAGQAVAARAQGMGLPICVVELNPELARKARQAGAAVVLGDATHWDILEEAGAASALAVVVTLPDDRDAVRVAQLVARSFPQTPLLVRARHQVTVPRLQQLGAVAVGEEELVGQTLAAKLAESLSQATG